MNGEIISLIEPAAQRAPRMKWHRDHGIGASENLGAGAHHESGERRGERPPAAVLEEVDHAA